MRDSGWDLLAPVHQIAPTLLGAVLTAHGVSVRLTEVEAYDGAADPASHAYRGRTRRNATMFGPPGHLYVYFTYGMHWAANIVCGPEGTASGVLLRSGEVVAGADVARSRRGKAVDRDLARGPGRLAQALGLSRADDGRSLFGDGPVTLQPGTPPEQIRNGPRVGVSVAAERPWRFWAANDRFVSPYRPATSRRRATRAAAGSSESTG
jgi:DNA-3-methyladenine glycosylase